MGKAKDVVDAVKEYGKETVRAIRETPPVSSANRRKLEGK